MVLRDESWQERLFNVCWNARGQWWTELPYLSLLRLDERTRGGPHMGRRDKIQLERPSAEHHSISSELLEKNFLMSYLFKSGSHLRSSDHKSKSGLHTLTQIVFYYARIGETGFLITNMTNFNWIIKINHKKVTSFEAKPMITIYPSHHVMDYEYHTVVTTVLKT